MKRRSTRATLSLVTLIAMTAPLAAMPSDVI
jgi:hypothetical protein